MLSYIFLSVLAIQCLFTSCRGQTWNDSVSLTTDMLKDYRKDHRPVLDQSNAISVNVSFIITNFYDLDEVTGQLTLAGQFGLSWTDELITWVPQKYGNTYHQRYSIKDVWYPMLLELSSIEKQCDMMQDWMKVVIVFTGAAYLYHSTLIKSVCAIDVTYYPFDSHECVLEYMPEMYSTKEVKLTAAPPIYDKTYTEMGEWELVENNTYVEDQGLFKVYLKFRRKPLFAVVNTIMPISLMSVLNVLVFILPPEAGERVSFSITVMLSTAVFMTMVADNLPKTSQPMPILAYFLLVNLMMSAVICLAVMLNLRVYFKKETQPVTAWLKTMVHAMQSHKKKGVGIYPLDLRDETKKPNEGSKKVVEHARGDEDTSIEEPVTWQDVATTIDKILILFFVVAMATSTSVFIWILVSNKGTIS